MSEHQVGLVVGRLVNVFSASKISQKSGCVTFSTGSVEVTLPANANVFWSSPRRPIELPRFASKWRPSAREDIKLDPNMIRIVEKIINHDLTHKEATTAVVVELTRELREGIINASANKGKVV